MFVELQPGNVRTTDGSFAITNPSVRNWFSGRLGALPKNRWSVIDVDAFLKEGQRVRWWRGDGPAKDQPSAYVLGTFDTLMKAKEAVVGLY